jgi:prefoldin alpha subunit
MATKDAPSAVSEQELQQSIMYLDQLKEQIATLKEQLEILELAVKEHNQAVETLKDFTNLKKDNEILIPIGADSMVFAKILDTSKVIINVGAGIAMEDTIETAIEKLSSRIEKIDMNKNKIGATINNLQDQAIQLSSSIEERYKNLQDRQNAEDNLRPPDVS